ncbi:hypothetical protein ACOBQX_11350 [Actinokineospora sp. G85]|uniref:hypothetical protein n=1 Tax=Actinokineospora sp. G85 TaxID=3406626 RepID=UPI003C75233D
MTTSSHPWRDQEPVPTGRVVSAEVDGKRGLLIPVRQAKTQAGIILLIVGLVFLGLAAWGLTGGASFGVVAGVAAALIGLLLFASGVFALRKPKGHNGLLLSPEGMTLAWFPPTVTVPWEQVTDVRPVVLRMGKSKGALVHNYLGVAATPRDAAGSRLRGTAARFAPDLAFVIAMRTVAVDQRLVLKAVRHYHTNPGDRAELGTDAAVTRVHG